MSKTIELVDLAAQAPAAAGITSATIGLLILGVVYCIWHKGTDWPAALIFTVVGIFLGSSAFAPGVKSTVNTLASGAFGAIAGMF